jgi:hypothetical protein
MGKPAGKLMGKKVASKAACFHFLYIHSAALPFLVRVKENGRWHRALRNGCKNNFKQVIGAFGRQGKERGSWSGQATLASSPFQQPIIMDQNRTQHGRGRGLRASVAGFFLAPVPLPRCGGWSRTTGLACSTHTNRKDHNGICAKMYRQSWLLEVKSLFISNGKKGEKGFISVSDHQRVLTGVRQKPLPHPFRASMFTSLHKGS